MNNSPPMNAHLLRMQDISELESLVIDEKGFPRVLSSEIYDQFPQNMISLLCVKHGIYCLPTTELVDFLKMEIGSQTAIEIGSGNGSMAKALQIHATDNYCQRRPEVIEHYKALGQATVKYGSDVENIDALDAIRRYRPRVVIASWFTHKYNPEQHDLGGNMYGVDEEDILKQVSRYILVGHEKAHQMKPIMKTHKPKVFKPDWLVGRSMNADSNAIFIWKGAKV